MYEGDFSGKEFLLGRHTGEKKSLLAIIERVNNPKLPNKEEA